MQLIRSVLHSIQVYWARVFILPCSVLNHIEQIFRQFRWKGPKLGASGDKVAWKDVCLPKNEGGLGICTIRESNKAAMLKHIWFLFTDEESLWCKLIQSTFLKDKNFWIAAHPTLCSWAWKKLLDLRENFQQHLKWRIGNNLSVSFWFDPWHPRGPLYRSFSNSVIYRLGIARLASVAEGLSCMDPLSLVSTSLAN